MFLLTILRHFWSEFWHHPNNLLILLEVLQPKPCPSKIVTCLYLASSIDWLILKRVVWKTIKITDTLPRGWKPAILEEEAVDRHPAKTIPAAPRIQTVTLPITQLRLLAMDLCRDVKQTKTLDILIFWLTSPGLLLRAYGHPSHAFFYFQKAKQMKQCRS